MNINLARKANEALMSGKKIEDYNLPKKVNGKIAKMKFTREQINSAYAKAANTL